MTADLVLITGATGHVGFAVLTEALRKGYTVRAAVRRESAITQLSAEPAIKPYLSRLTFTLVPDINIDGAFDKALESVTHVIHLASPLSRPTDDPERDIITPAIRGTRSILNSALKVPTVRKVVITASIASIRPADAAPSDMLDPDAVIAEPHGPYANPFLAYGASKVKAHHAVLKLVTDHKPSFSVVNVMPGFIIGPKPLAKIPQEVRLGSNRIVLDLLLGQPDSPRFSQLVHIDDAAFVHVAALDDGITGVQNFGLAYKGFEGGVDVNLATDIVRTKFAKEVQEGIFPLGGHRDIVPSAFDVRKTEAVFGFKQKDFESMVVDVAEYYAKVWRENQGAA